ncbi:hypothetical protein N7491_009330 [Penicillium cf. griseofulvum]|uniref:Uncharacterized protein n=1 Tax=Penicillium cf. griseofulvum TaxID=2972120 RepID=A0A9W9JMT5_9EURO|nr:hypothetical protein N7472_005077 [Penicillium cf. griseofulvum]KAJ5424114.1 hypothetical protein N7491_009330 [Penicillium cf. griseofulvum]KAJ5442646.1 hypothetical protein N7445_005653 [Penicillium cf. griseofulvum]
MNISNNLRQHYVFPAAGFIAFPDIGDYLTYEDPAEQMKSTPPAPNANWRIDGAAFGVYYWVTPVSMHPLPPMNIHLKIPDQTAWPRELWVPLSARDSVHMSDERIKSLGITEHLTRALNAWWERDPEARETYKKLPFGSYISCSEIKVNPEDMDFYYLPNEDLDELLLTAKELQSMWGFDQIPDSVPIEQPHCERHIQASVGLVTLAGTQEQYVFKGRSRPNALYNEIKMLLSIDRHPNIIERPVKLVTIQLDATSEARVCGFLLPYHENGALQEALPQLRLQGELKLCAGGPPTS